MMMSMRCSADDASPWRRRLYDVTALLWPKRHSCKILEKVNFSQTDDPSAISDLAYSTTMYNVGLHAKFRGRTQCHLGVNSADNSHLLYRLIINSNLRHISHRL